MSKKIEEFLEWADLVIEHFESIGFKKEQCKTAKEKAELSVCGIPELKQSIKEYRDELNEEKHGVAK